MKLFVLVAFYPIKSSHAADPLPLSPFQWKSDFNAFPLYSSLGFIDQSNDAHNECNQILINIDICLCMFSSQFGISSSFLNDFPYTHMNIESRGRSVTSQIGSIGSSWGNRFMVQSICSLSRIPVKSRHKSVPTAVTESNAIL